MVGHIPFEPSSCGLSTFPLRTAPSSSGPWRRKGTTFWALPSPSIPPEGMSWPCRRRIGDRWHRSARRVLFIPFLAVATGDRWCARTTSSTSAPQGSQARKRRSFIAPSGSQIVGLQFQGGGLSDRPNWGRGRGLEAGRQIQAKSIDKRANAPGERRTPVRVSFWFGRCIE